MKWLYIKTYGCQMNVYDSARMADVMAPHGYALTETPDNADMIILNTCHIREKAAEKVYSEIGRLRPYKRRKEEVGERMIIAVGGCVGQAEGEEIITRADSVDLVFGPQTFHRLPELVVRALRATGEKVVDIDFPTEDKFDHLPEESSPQGVSTFLTIQEGCDKFCTFCVVPYTRGAEQSRPVVAIIAEAHRLAEAGSRELTLLGQNVNAYHGQGPDGTEWSLGQLLFELAKSVPAIKRLRYTTSHPRDVNDTLLAAHRDIPQVMPYLHLPVQSGSDHILAAMNRKHSADDYRRVVDRLRAARADLALSSDFIVGYPGETDQNFAETLRLVTEIGYVQAYSFKYSARPGTPAATEGQVPAAVKDERLASLQQLLRAQQTAFNRSKLETVMPVLFERKGRYSGQLLGRSPYMQPVHAEAPERLIGNVVECRVVKVMKNSLKAEVLTVDTGSRSDRTNVEKASA